MLTSVSQCTLECTLECLINMKNSLTAPTMHMKNQLTTPGPASSFNVHTASNEISTSNSIGCSPERILVSALTSISTKLDHLSVKVEASKCEVKNLQKFKHYSKALNWLKQLSMR